MSHGVYCWTGLLIDHWKRLAALQRLLPNPIFAGTTAAWMHGLDVDLIDPIEVILPVGSAIRSRPGLTVHHTNVTLEVVDIKGLRATSINRTLYDLCLRTEGVEALILLDSALHLRLTSRDQLKQFGTCLRSLAPLAEPAESPMETRLRWLLLNAGLPRPEVQVNLHDTQGRFLGRADLYYPHARLAIEFDGGNHRERLVEDNRRQNLLINAGYKVLRFTASDIYQRPESILAQVSAGAALSARRRAAAPR